MKSLKYVFALLFSLQGIFMSGVMAAGKTPWMLMDTNAKTAQVDKTSIFDSGALDVSMAGKENPDQNHEEAFQKSASCCCVVKCGCIAFVLHSKEFLQRTGIPLKANSTFFHFTEPPSFVLPEPPRTTFI